jgi:hypothetical protein
MNSHICESVIHLWKVYTNLVETITLPGRWRDLDDRGSRRNLDVTVSPKFWTKVNPKFESDSPYPINLSDMPDITPEGGKIRLEIFLRLWSRPV